MRDRPADAVLLDQLIERELRLAAGEQRNMTCPLCDALVRAFALSSALACLAWHVIRYGGGPVPNSQRTWLASHDEWSNRTRHVLALGAEMPQPTTVLLLGRPRHSAGDLRAMLRRELPSVRFQFVRPFDLASFAKSLGQTIGATLQANRRLARCRKELPLGDLVGIFYRVQLGCVSARWWKHSGNHPDVVIFGHTGNADASLLEAAIQRGGATTVHLFHGYSNGEAFTGISDIAIAKCASDAKWHRARGGYGDTLAAATDMPQLASPSGGWVLLTNYAHPTAFASAATGARFERDALELVAQVAARLKVEPGVIKYRPHPQLRSLQPMLQQQVDGCAARLNLSSWESPDAAPQLAGFEIVLTTPSTMVGDVLLAGGVPIVIDLAGVQEGSAYASYPFRGRSADDLVRLIEEVRSDRVRAFSRAWEAIGPAVTPSVAQIERLALSYREEHRTAPR